MTKKMVLISVLVSMIVFLQGGFLVAAQDSKNIKIVDAFQLSTGNILVGMNQSSKVLQASQVMFGWLTDQGEIDTAVGHDGSLCLDTVSGDSQHVTAVVADASGKAYITGSVSSESDEKNKRAMLRSYTAKSTNNWTTGQPDQIFEDAERKDLTGIALGLQGEKLLLSMVHNEINIGFISRYHAGKLDFSFGENSYGLINPFSYGLNMGPVYDLVVDADHAIFTAFVDFKSLLVHAVKFAADGTQLVDEFATVGVASNLFPDLVVAVDNVRSALRLDHNFMIATTVGSTLYVTSLDGDTGKNNGSLRTEIMGSSVLSIKKITALDDGKVIISLSDEDGKIYAVRLLSSGLELDPTFNWSGQQQGVLSVNFNEQTTKSVVQSFITLKNTATDEGKIIALGVTTPLMLDKNQLVTEPVYVDQQDNQLNELLTRVNTPGTFSSATDLNSLLGTSAPTVLYTYLTGSSHDGYALIGYDNGTTSKVARYNIAGGTLDTSFNTTGIYTIPGSLTGISTISIDSKNRIIVGGTSGSTPWAYQIADNGSSSVAFGTFPAGMNGVNQILQQDSGRYIVAGSTNAPAGIIVAFQSELPTPNSLIATTLAIDTTFNPLAADGATAGSYILGTTGIYSMVIAATTDRIYLVYKGATYLTIAALSNNGSGIYSGFNSGAVLTTTIAADSSSVCRIAFAVSGSLVVAASTGSGANVTLQRFTQAGGNDTTWNTTGAVTTVSNLGSAGITLADLMVTSPSNQTIFLGYNTAGGNGKLFACRLTTGGILDTAWNPSPVAPDTAGVLTFNTNSVTKMNGSSIMTDGTITAVGQQSGGTAGHPIIMYVYGTTGDIQRVQSPGAAAAGTLDLTLPGSSSGILALAGTVTGRAQKISIYNNNTHGAMMIASSDGTNSYVAMLNADLSLVSTATYGTSGVATMLGKATISDMYLPGNFNSNTLAPILVSGTSSSAMWGAQISTDGDTITYLASVSGMTTGNVIRQTNNGRILVAGYNGSSGIIAAFSSVASGGVLPLDTSFGNNGGVAPNYGGGIYVTGVNGQIFDIAVDSYNRIYIAYRNAPSTTQIVVQRLLANGTGIDTTFSATFPTATTAYTSSQIRLALDEANSQLVVIAQDGTTATNFIRVNRFNMTNGSSTGSTNAITISSVALWVGDLFIDAAQNIYFNGYNPTGNLIVARIASTSSSTIALDTTGYAVSGGTPGIANYSAGSLTNLSGAAYSPDRRVYVVGYPISPQSGYMARLYGDIYTTEVSEALITPTVGSIDTSLQPNNTGQIDLSGQTGWSGLAGGYKARAIIENPNNDGTAFIAFGNDTNLIVGKVNPDMTPITTFGDSGSSNGLTAAIAMATVNSITIDGDSNIIVAGTTTAPAQKVISFTSAGTFNATFATTVASTNGSVVVQQKSGRYIVGGYDGSANGLIIAYKNQSAISSTTLPIDATFGPAAQSGYFPTGVNAPIDDLCIDSNDNIYFTYRNASNVVCLGKLTANGSGLVDAQNSPATFNSGAIVTTGITGVTGGNPSRIAINSSGNILVGNTRVTGLGSPAVQVELYNGTTGAIIGSTVTVYNSATPVLTKLVGSGTNFYGSIYNTTPTISVFSINNSGAMDNGFGASGITTITSGSTYQYVKAMYGLSVQSDGQLVVVGYNNPSNNGTTFDPSLMRFNGYQYVGQYAQAPNRVAAGQLDTTLWPTTGDFSLKGTTNSTFNTLMSSYAVKRVYESGNGIMTFVADNGNDTVIFQMLKDLTLNTAFNTTGYRSFTTTYGGTTGLYVDTLGNIFMCGTYSGASWAIGLSSTGANLSPVFSPSSTLTSAKAINQQSNGSMILAGLGATNGTLKAYNNTGALDTTFGTAGTLDIGGAYSITGIAIDSTDRIITVANNAGTVVLKRVTASGLAVGAVSAVTTIGVTAITTAVSGSDIKVVLDTGGRIIVAAATATGYALRSYNNDATGTDNAGAISIAPSGGSGTFILSNMYATSDGKITLIGYRATSGTICVARMTSGAGGLTLDSSTFNASTGYLYTTIGSLNLANDGIIHADNRVMIVGSNLSVANPYMGRTFGYPYVTYTSQGPIEGIAGTINPGFGSTSPTTGTYDVSTLNAVLTNAQGKAILPVSNGGYFMAFDNANTAANSILIKTVSSGDLDTSYNSTGIATTYAPLGVNSILQDASSKMLLIGTNPAGSGNGWVQRYATTGALDTTFNGTGIINLASGTQATVAIEQTLGRLVVAGINTSGKGSLFAYQSVSPNGTPGSVDTTFNNTGTVPAVFSTTVSNAIPCIIADSYDRLIFGILNGTAVDLYRLTPTGQLDITFGTDGIVANAITSATSASSVHVALDLAGNIIVAANSSTLNTFSVRGFNNGTSTGTGGNGAAVYAQLNIASLIAPTLTNLITSADGYTLIVGTQSGTGAAWIARITAGGLLDTTGFNPAAIGGIAGIFQYTGSGSTAHSYYGLAVNANGTLGMLGFENSSSVYTPTLVSVYDLPYTSQVSQSPNAKAVGTNDLTLGASTTSTTNKGITFFGASGNVGSAQIARAVGLYDDNNVVVAIDGNSTTGSGTSEIMINMFNNDGIANPNFGTAGTAIVLSDYQNQYVNDMVTFTTVAGIHKAILAGYATNTDLGKTGSLLLQYVLTPGSSALDSSFGGLYGNSAGVAFGDGQQLFSVARQSNGRIIAAGLSQNSLGLLLGYGSNGVLDSSFANNGYQSANTGAAGIYTHAVDTNNNIVFAYNSSNSVQVARYLADGSALDSTFTTPTPLIATISGNTNMKVAVDSSNKVYVAGVIASGNSIMVKQYATTGGAALQTVTLTGTVLGNASAVYSLARLLVDAAGNTIVVAYDSNAKRIVVVRLTTVFALDTSFNGTGFITYAVAGGSSSQVATDAMITPDGRILVSGSEL
ncbi:hypothetical protein KBC04_01950 [Candidatus Babeliales bacterium]|nr:hypothetical protein [Candidatus Babeliales bacterium]MBP9843828.1 hypothetical protein [Candidatus Babeliales bacterium]